MKVEDEYLDVLQNIEFGIIGVFRADRSLLDLDAKDVPRAEVKADNPLVAVTKG